MSWLLLLLLVPLIVIPVVMLLGFAGCSSFEAAVAPVTQTPGDFFATRAGVAKISLKWTHPSGGSAKFEIRRAIEGGGFTTIKTDWALMTFDDEDSPNGLLDGTTFHYEVIATVAGTPSAAAKASATTEPKPPVDLEVTAEESDHIDLQWKNASAAKIVSFLPQSRQLPNPAVQKHPLVSGTKGSATGLIEGSEYELKVSARVKGIEDGAAKDVDSVPSGAVKANTWKRAFGTVLGETDIVRSGSTLVQRIPATTITGTGGAVRITLKGIPGLPATLLRVYISQPSVAVGAQAWDPGADLKQVDFGPGLEIALDGQSLRSKKTPYTVEAGKDVVIAIDVKPETPARDVPVTRSTINGVRRFVKNAVSEASFPDRTGNYNTTQNQLFWIEQIEVTAS